MNNNSKAIYKNRATLRVDWIGVDSSNPDNIMIFDVNAMSNGTGWVTLSDWENIVVPYILEGIPKANGRWHMKCCAEIESVN